MCFGLMNLIIDIYGLCVGNVCDDLLWLGVMVLMGDVLLICGVNVMGGVFGMWEIDLLVLDKMVQGVDVLVLLGGFVFGLVVCDGVVVGLWVVGCGFLVGLVQVFIVLGVIVFDLLNGGDKDWEDNFYLVFGCSVFDMVVCCFVIGSEGVGIGVMMYCLKGGLGLVLVVLDCGIIVGVLVVVNVLGLVIVGDSCYFWVVLWEMQGEFGNFGFVFCYDLGCELLLVKCLGEVMIIVIVVIDVVLDKVQVYWMVIVVQDGMVCVIVFSYMFYDGDLVFVVLIGVKFLFDFVVMLFLLGYVVVVMLVCVIVCGVYVVVLCLGDL